MTKWIVIAVLVLMGIIGVGMYFSTSNQEIDLRNQAIAQQEANKVVYDKVWKVIRQKAQIADKYAVDFKGIYGNIMQERYQGDSKQAPLFKWIQEHNPTFSVDLYKDLSDAVEANRAEFARVQNRLIDIKREHTVLLQKFPSNLFVGSRPELKMDIVTSTQTVKTFETGKEDDINLFNKK